MWVNSLGLDGGALYISNLFADLQDGVAILKVMDAIQPGVVVWKKVNNPPKNRYKKVSSAAITPHSPKSG
jgi:plastin-1